MFSYFNGAKDTAISLSNVYCDISYSKTVIAKVTKMEVVCSKDAYYDPLLHLFGVEHKIITCRNNIEDKIVAKYLFSIFLKKCLFIQISIWILTLPGVNLVSIG